MTLLSPRSRQAGCYPSFATHDEEVIEEIIAAARERGWEGGQFEFEMLYGVQPDLQRGSVGNGLAGHYQSC
jgi:proline dehydrogenase